ncbi:hypothetical protein [Aquimarina sp. 2201CG5-10]|uniref:hypothetical protein n=1 Tax=Aquimarina callyspongiae TaxID=3098150 RepID=UPI002AB5A691|nr:hypothetical protein [Aquimarina sp. 2201CG5-10]MDY8137002.1 hypothetical protein [Aquimarina sp. 2201CG5-10]
MSSLFSSFQLTDKTFYIIIGIIVILSIVAISYYFSDRNRILRKLKSVVAKRILLVKENEYAKIIGKAQHIDESLISPIGKRKCVYYQIKVEEERGGKNKHWHTIIKEEKAIDFIIESKGEKAIIKPHTGSQAKLVYIIKDVKHKSGFWKDSPAFLENYLKSHGKDSTGLFGFNKKIRYREGVIEIGETIAVMGIGNWKETDQSFDRYSSKNLFLSGDKTNKLLITDDPKAIKTK